MSFKHNPEFHDDRTYEAYTDYVGVAAMAEEMVNSVAQEVLGTTKVTFPDHENRLAAPWRRVTFVEAMKQYGGPDLEEFATADTLREELRRRGVDAPAAAGYGKLCDEAMSHYIEPNLIQPTFLLDYPVELSPLAKRKPGSERFRRRFECFAAGFEFGNAYTALNDPMSSERASKVSWRCLPPGKTRSNSSTRISSSHSNTGCRRRAGSGWASTG